MDIARSRNIEPYGTNHRRWKALVIKHKIYDELNDSALFCACDEVSAHMPALCDGIQTCLAYKGYKTWKSMVADTEFSVRTVAE